MHSRTRPLILVAMLVAASSCATSSAPGPSLEESLSLSVVPATVSVPDGSVLPVSLSLLNRSQVTVAACLSEGSGFNLIGAAAGKGNATTIDHPGCVELFRIPPGKALTWSSTYALPFVGPGPARLKGWVQVVDPRHCGQYGCDHAHISSAFVQLTLLPK